MTLPDLAALFAAMALLAAVPSVSVLAVTARSASHGFAHGATTAAGIVMADLLFILLAIFGLSVLVQALGALFAVLKCLAGAYLLWIAHTFWRTAGRPLATRPDASSSAETRPASFSSSFMTGLLITLADQKAVFFYLGFLPAFIELDRLKAVDIGAVALVTLVAVGGVKLLYAAAARRTTRISAGRWAPWVARTAAAVLAAAGLLMLVRGAVELA